MRHLLATLLMFPMLAAAQSPEPAPVETIPVQALPETAKSNKREQSATPVQLETVTVKGEKLGRSLSETTTSVSVFSGKNIADMGDDTLSELLRRAANTTANEEGNISIRGVSQAGAGGGVGAPLISVQLDGVTLDRTAQQGALDELFDVDQVEVLRGAQSTSQGRNALAGAVVINTREPTRDWDLRTRIERGGRDLRSIAVAGGGPLSESIGFRLAGSFDNNDGFITHQPDGNPDFARTQKSLVRGKLGYAPQGGAFDSLLTLSADRNDGQPDYNMESGESGSDPAQRRRVQINDPSRDLTRSGTASLRNRYRINERFALTAITAHLRTQQDYVRDYDGLAEDGGTNLVLAHGRNVSQELRLNVSDWGAFTGVVGVYGGLFKDDNTFFSNDVFVDANYALGSCVDTPAGCIPVSVPVAGELLGVELDFVTTSNREARNIAGFAEFDIRLPWQLTASLGLRYDTESLDTLTNSATTRGDARVRTPAGVNETAPLAPALLEQLPGINVLPVLLQVPGVLPNTNGEQRASTRYSALLPKIGLRWAFAPQWSVFAGYTEGYRAGGVDVDTQTSEALPYKPEYTRNVEMGVRGDFARWDFAVNVFHTRWRDQQVPVLRGFFFVNQNAANSKLSGAELSLGWRLLPTLRTQASLGLVQTEFIEYIAAGSDFSGNQFIFAPRHTVSVGGVWRPRALVPGMMVALNLSHRGKAFTSPANAADERSESRTLLDGRIGYERGFFRGYLFGKNLTDNDRVTETYQFRNGYAGAPTPRGYAAYTARLCRLHPAAHAGGAGGGAVLRWSIFDASRAVRFQWLWPFEQCLVRLTLHIKRGTN